MKKIITTFIFAVALLSSFAQTSTNFETFTLSPNSFYKDTNSVPFQSPSVLFRYYWDTQFDFWSGGFAYTNKTDTSSGYPNIYSARTGKGYNNSAKYATGQTGAVMVLKAPFDRLDGFYITNTTYAFKSMKNGDQFAKKFGGASGNDPDWFKLTAKAFLNGSMKNDSSVFYLADFRFANNSSDYIIESWQWFNTSNLGEADSIKFFMYSSDVSFGFMNTPAFFSLDEVTVSDAFVGLKKNTSDVAVSVYPNPFSSVLNVQASESKYKLLITDITGKSIFTANSNEMKNQIDMSLLSPGIYFAEIEIGNNKIIRKIVKQ
jgi:hypothetical protein